MLKEIVCAGLGGQGVLTQGKILIETAANKELNATWFPASGNEMRGGAASCNVIISEAKIASPYADHPQILITMSESAIDEWAESMAPGGVLLVNSTVVPDDKKYREDIKVIKAPVTQIAQQHNSERNANLVMLGVLAKSTDLFSYEELEAGMCKYFEDLGKAKYNDKNKEVLRAGYDL